MTIPSRDPEDPRLPGLAPSSRNLTLAPEGPPGFMGGYTDNDYHSQGRGNLVKESREGMTSQ